MLPKPFYIANRSIFYRYFRLTKGSKFDKAVEKMKDVAWDDKLFTGLKMFKQDCINLFKEYKEIFGTVSRFCYNHGNYQTIFQFNTKSDLDQWIVTADKDNCEGTSQAKLYLSPQGTAIFCGNLEPYVSCKGGQLDKKGYVSLASKVKFKPFARMQKFNWSQFTHIMIKLRGDGRNYMLNLNCPGYWDADAFDMFSYPIYTRGGPYWQIARIPFSKFVFNFQGIAQDYPLKPYLNSICTINIALMDKINGPFRLELDKIWVVRDERHTEACAYETYKTPRYIVTKKN